MRMRMALVIPAIVALGAAIAFASSQDSERGGHAGHGATSPTSPSSPSSPSERPGDRATTPVTSPVMSPVTTPTTAPTTPHAGYNEKSAVAPVAAAPTVKPTEHAGHGDAQAPTTPAKVKGPREEPRAPIEVTPEQQMRIGLATTAAVSEGVRHSIRAVGSVVADERREAQVHTRVAGWIDDISVSAVGAEVKRGQVLYRLYAPELVSTQQELVASRKQGELGRRLADAALERLSLWSVAPSEIEALKNGGEPKRALAFTAPMSGYVIDKMAVKGAYVTPEMELYRIADLSKVWIVVALYENELPLVSVGDLAEVKLTGLNNELVRAPVSFIYPDLDTATRTGRARIEVDNKDLAFKPGMFANVSIEKDLGIAVVVPEDAIIFTGQRNLVFKKTSETRFVPVEVNVGPRVEGGRVILVGVAAGDELVVRASFLIDAESRLRAALEKGGSAQGHTGHGG